MLKKGNDILAGLPATVIAGLFLLLDLLPHLIGEFGGDPAGLSFLPFDPAWVTVIISGIPMLYFAQQVGIKQVRAQLLPEEKVNMITAMQNEGKNVCMIGDGVNDAPALKTADVGVAMGGLGSDIAVEAADVVLMQDDISRLPYLKKLSNATVKTIRFSIGLSMCINFLALTCSVLGILNPTTGALVHNAGSCFVVLIAALLYDRKFE